MFAAVARRNRATNLVHGQAPRFGARGVPPGTTERSTNADMQADNDVTAWQ